MILFPYAKDLEYKEQTLAFTLQFFDNEIVTNIEVLMPLDSDLSDLMEELLEKQSGTI
jgi:hypothetical protein